MTNRSNLATVFASIVAVAVFSAPALAERSQYIAFADEVDSCIAAVTSNLDLDEASRVRHVVTERDRSGSAHALSIETSVFSGSDVRIYEAYCLVRGTDKPMRFRIAEIVD